MGGLAHYIEEEGIATTQISLIREHTEIIKPPRALWVSFPLGRPLGDPDEPEFQSRVLKHTLSLLEHKDGPVLEDFPEDGRENMVEQAQIACPVYFEKPAAEQGSMAELFKKFQQELNRIQTWYDLACEQRGRSTVGVSGLSYEAIDGLFHGFIQDEVDEKLLADRNLADVLRLAAEDLKTCYLEGLGAQPGQPTDATTLADWFWGETYAGIVINEVRKKCLQYTEQEMQLAGKLLLVPRNQLHRFATNR